ncbi:Mitochondrial import inner membrane translocase subunit tim8 [Knufia fluminis]|uniref:Mitochondrial import inner membrane translocase subunit n=1 Tax=Knufia fluminis TaxID=191047 RepID=A0AAN8EFH8_9EURO|nr:Mitochondrial import inner membrane translocase subunit tim8 [Knufia fluminis]
MDTGDEISISQEDIQRLSPADQRDLQQFLQAKNQEATFQRTIHELTETCFKKCIARGSISTGRLNSKESSCMTNCVGRFMDSNLAVLRHLEMMRQSQ